MARVKRGVTAHAKHKKVLEQAKGYYGRRKNTIRIAKQAVEKANQYAYRDRKNRKRNFRALWIQRINAAARGLGLTYGRLIDGLEPRRDRGGPKGALRSRHPRAGGLRGAGRAGEGRARLPEGEDAGRVRQGGRREDRRNDGARSPDLADEGRLGPPFVFSPQPLSTSEAILPPAALAVSSSLGSRSARSTGVGRPRKRRRSRFGSAGAGSAAPRPARSPGTPGKISAPGVEPPLTSRQWQVRVMTLHDFERAGRASCQSSRAD